ncbi:MAG: SpoIIE family protein phosphatase [Firmicutes bacterium]|nr:SpoIIE family protein phosphatase [Bacillota bacterium]
MAGSLLLSAKTESDAGNSAQEALAPSRWTSRALSVGALLLTFLLGQAIVYHHATPLAWVLLIVLWNEWRQLFLPALLGALIGTAIGSGWLIAFVLLGLVALIPLPFRMMRWPAVTAFLAAGGSAVLYIAGGVAMPLGSVYVILSALAGLFLYWALLAQRDSIAQGQGSAHSIVVVAVLAGGALAGMASYHMGPIDMALLVGAVLMLFSAGIGGIAGGIIAGTVLGMTWILRQGPSAGDIGALVSSGFLAGWLQARHWRWSSVGILLGLLGYAVLIGTPAHFLSLLLAFILAAILYQALPGSFVLHGIRWMQTLIAGETPDSLALRMTTMAQVMEELSAAFHVAEPEMTVMDTNVVEPVVRDVCHKCSLYRTCWEDDFYRTYRGLSDMMTLPEARLLRTIDLNLDLQKRCIHADLVVQAANIERNRLHDQKTLERRLKESRSLAEHQLKALSEMIMRMAQDPRLKEGRPAKRHTLRLDVLYGLAKRPRRGGTVTGDSDLECTLGTERLLLALSDGMGVGARAAWESGTALSLLEQLMKAGLSQKMSVEAVNTTLLLRSVHEHFATLDLLLIDREKQGAEIVKVSAAPTFLRRGSHVEIIRAQSLPIGIVDHVDVEPVYHTIEAGDVLVMATDGIFDRDIRQSEEKLAAFVANTAFCHPQVMAETILSYMIGDEKDGRDDAAVMVVRLFEHNKVPDFEKGQGLVKNRPWQRLTPRPIRQPAGFLGRKFANKLSRRL